MYFILFIAIAVASYAVQSSLKSKFSTYSKTPLSNGMYNPQNETFRHSRTSRLFS